MPCPALPCIPPPPRFRGRQNPHRVRRHRSDRTPSRGDFDLRIHVGDKDSTGMGLDDIAAISLPTRGRTGWPSHRFCCFANFDLRTRAGDGPPAARRASHFRHFNPHTCLGGSLLMSGPGRGCNHFGSCLSAWERGQANTSEAPCRADFSPLALRERMTRSKIAGSLLHFKPCSCVGTTPEQTRQNGEKQAFTHAPTRGRPRGAFASANPRGISIHVPAQGATVPRVL